MKKIVFISISIILGLSSFKLADLYLRIYNKDNRTNIQVETWNSRLTQFQSEVEWTKVVIDERLKIPQIEENDWSYPWYMVKHENGFENTLGEPIVKEDTVR